MKNSKSAYLSLVLGLAVILSGLVYSYSSHAETRDFHIYGVFRPLHMGDEGEVSYKDFYINMGTKDGISVGSKLDVFRKTASFDLLGKRLHKDMIYHIGTVKVIHAEKEAAVARLVSMEKPSEAPAISPYGVMVGDLIQRSE